MSSKYRLILACFLLLLVVSLIVVSVNQAGHLRRDPSVLLNHYYALKRSHPAVARKSLLILLAQDDQYLPAIQEYSQLLLNDPQPELALPWLEQLHSRLPDNEGYAFQLGYLYYLKGDWQQSKLILADLSQKVTGDLKIQVDKALKAMASYIPYYQDGAYVEWVLEANRKPLALIPLRSHKTVLQRKGSLKSLSLRPTIKSVHESERAVVHRLKEAGFEAIRRGDRLAAIQCFTRAYELSFQPSIALQLAYLYDQLNNKPAAYRYFKLATLRGQKNRLIQAEKALTNIGGEQTKGLPSPYFSDVFFSPFTQDRFGLTVEPFYWRLGLEQNNRLQTKEYAFLRRTQDNRSTNLGEISQIYEDDVQITGIGLQTKPLNVLPIYGFVEVGEAYDLIYQQRNRWRGDVRVGLMYYQVFGAEPSYFNELKWGHDYYSTWYGDVVYFSRYNNNIIGSIRTHQGIHLLQYKSSMVNLYVTGRMIEDTNRDFYNNIAEIGPGIGFIPTNRFNLQLRYECVRGVYLPAGGSINPYGKYYNNQLVQLIFYVKI